MNKNIMEKSNESFVYLKGEKVSLSKTLILKKISDVITEDESLELSNLLAKISTQEKKVVTRAYYSDRLDEEAKSVYGIKIGETKKAEVLNFIKEINPNELKNYSPNSKIWKINELGMTIYFSSWDIVEEIVLTEPFTGQTLKGICIGDSLDKASEVYGEPRIRSLVSAFWNNFSVFVRDEIITGIKIY